MIQNIFPKDSFNQTDSVHLAFRNEPDEGDFTHCLLQIYCGTTDNDLGVWLLPNEVEELIKGLEQYLDIMKDRPITHRFQNCHKRKDPNEG